MNKALGLNMYDVGAQHVEPVVKFSGARLIAATENLVSDLMISPDFERPAGMLLHVARAAGAANDPKFTVARTAEAANEPSFVQAPKFGLN